ncbi:immunity 49 family protein [Streptomyces yunnanensis]|uniref:Immunity protein 49 n=1 Tax=Streptomyces yunnanensis TaxID=156453 RepID=A0A9X8MU41_9ACTN|nr:immunity 49 family protein [Streptomyces yunnanensis]SHL81567.1 Immunity protein 49 [Streptomyces yunnanensis]
MSAAIDVTEKSINAALTSLETSDDAREAALRTSLNIARMRCVLDPKAVMLETWESWLLAMQVHSAVFAAASTDEEAATCQIRQVERRLVATGPQFHVNAGTWVQAFYLALVCRETARLDMLANIPVSLLRDCGGVMDEYIYAWVETLQSFWLRRDDLSDKLVQAVDLNAPEAARIVDAQTMGKLSYPPIILFYRYLRRDAEGFNTTLADALRWHKECWIADTDRKESVEGVVALGPLAIACLARAVSIPIKIESPYLPQALLDYAWEGEFDA